jgi:hypothetical protein
VGAEGLAWQRGGLLASSAKVSDLAARSPVQKQEMSARGSSGGTEYDCCSSMTPFQLSSYSPSLVTQDVLAYPRIFIFPGEYSL